MQYCQEKPLVPPCLRGLCSADLTPREGRVGFDGTCPAARFPGTQDASLPAPDGTSQHTIALLLIIFTSVIQTQALFHLSLLTAHIRMTHPQSTRLSRCCSAMEIPAFLQILQVLPPLHPNLIFFFITHRKTAKSSACLPVKSYNSYVVGVETTAQQERRSVCWVKLAQLVGILGIIFCQLCCITPHSPKHLCGWEDLLLKFRCKYAVNIRKA